MLHTVKNRVQTNWRGNSWKPFQIWLNQWYGHVDRMVQFTNAIIRTNIIASEFDCESGLACIFALSVGNIFWPCKWKIMERRKSSKWRWGLKEIRSIPHHSSPLSCGGPSSLSQFFPLLLLWALWPILLWYKKKKKKKVYCRSLTNK